MLGTVANNITLVKRVKTGFTLTVKDELARRELLDSSAARRESGISLEPASNLVVLRIATVPVRINTLTGSVFITEKMVAHEITRVNISVPFLVRPYGSDSRFCEARPNKSSSVKKEQLAIILNVERKNHADYARVKVAAEIAIQAIYGSKNDVYISDGSGLVILESEEGV